MQPGRGCGWVPDYAWLSLLLPIANRLIEISGPQQISVQDASNQTINASTVSNITFSANTLVANTWPVLTLNQAVLIESLRAAILPTDASGKIQVNTALLMTGDAVNSGIPAFLSCGSLPFTAAAIANVGAWIVGQNPMPLIIPRPTVSPNGPLVQFIVTNTDGGSSHTYKRSLLYTYRIISNVDFTSGPMLRGAGVGLQ